MNTTEKNNRIKTLKCLIANAVEAHKSTKKIARMSPKAEDFDSRESGAAQYTYRNESDNLFVAYTVYYMLRHGIEGEENVKAYINDVLSHLRPEKRNRHDIPTGFSIIPLKNCKHRWYSNLHDAVKTFIEHLDSYVEGNDGGEQ